jgi:p-aminobenzoyl-glutamate transporter AbgT
MTPRGSRRFMSSWRFGSKATALRSLACGLTIGDSPVNSITPLNAYFAVVVGFAQRYDRKAGVGTVVALMLPYVIWISIVWTILFVIWYLLGLPWGI